MFVAALEDPRLFNGFGYLVTDQSGQMDVHVLQFFAGFSKSAVFIKHMKKRYPRTNPKTQPMLHHIFEFFIRHFAALKPIDLNQPEIKTDIDTVARAAADIKIKAMLYQLMKEKSGSTNKALPLQYHAFLYKQRSYPLPRNSSTTQADTLFYDMKYLLLKYPIS